MGRRKLKVLVVDDEEAILDLLVLAFEEAGFDVATASNALGAHTILEESGSISLVVTDVSMPGSIDGVAFGQFVSTVHPEIPLIVISGVTRPDDRDLPVGAAFVPKPFKPSLLVDEAKLMLSQAR
ncbi:MAG TPA: response regulator [Allosphingosinicella sp.]|jgi:DNA-binding NtrC family response regulator|uniref:response regulator n=1 Tax=Allosphingosinicella sp. TaxID=2823234 RepID=UPI002F2A7082